MKFQYRKVILITILVVSFIGISFFFFLKDSIMRCGKQEITLEVFSEYKEYGAMAYSKGLAVEYSIDGEVDTSVVGDYQLTYALENNPDVFTTRIIHVVDTTKPVIVFENEDSIFDIMDDNRFNDYVISDNYDQNPILTIDIPENCNGLGKYEIVYNLIDCCGNQTIVKREVTIADLIAPTITIKRKINSYAILNNPIDLSYTATDLFDGDITNKVEVEGTVDFSTIGFYTLKYTVCDSSNNKTELVTTINVQKKNKKGIPVLMYHWFYDDLAGETCLAYLEHNYVAKSELIKQIEYLKSNHFYFADFEELRDYIDGKIDLPRNTIIITDDDAQESFFKIALPIFMEYNVPVTSFTSTGRYDYWLDYQNIDCLTYQSHSHNMHTKIKGEFAVYMMTYEEMVEDCQTSIALIGHNDALAYPYGYVTEDYINAAKYCEFKVCFTTEYDLVKVGSDPYLLPRIRITHNLTIDQFINTVK